MENDLLGGRPVSSTERNAMTSLPPHRIHGWIVPAIAALAAALALLLPGIARADDGTQIVTATSTTAVSAPAVASPVAPGTSAAGTADTPANSDGTSAPSSSPDDAPATATTTAAPATTGSDPSSSTGD